MADDSAAMGWFRRPEGGHRSSGTPPAHGKPRLRPCPASGWSKYWHADFPPWSGPTSEPDRRCQDHPWSLGITRGSTWGFCRVTTKTPLPGMRSAPGQMRSIARPHIRSALATIGLCSASRPGGTGQGRRRNRRRLLYGEFSAQDTVGPRIPGNSRNRRHRNASRRDRGGGRRARGRNLHRAVGRHLAHPQHQARGVADSARGHGGRRLRRRGHPDLERDGAPHVGGPGGVGAVLDTRVPGRTTAAVTTSRDSPK
jgi:hypothetical protein